MALEKFLSIQRSIKFGTRIRTFTLIILLLISAILNSHYLFTMAVIELHIQNLSAKMCTSYRWLDFNDHFWPYIDATIYLFIPFIILIIIDALIIERKTNKLQFKINNIPVPRLNLGNKRTTAVNMKNKTSLSEYNNIKSSRMSQDSNKSHSISLHRVDKLQKASQYELSLKLFHKSKSLNDSLPSMANMSRRRLAVFDNSLKPLLKLENSRLKISRDNVKKRTTLITILINVSFCVLTVPLGILKIMHKSFINSKAVEFKFKQMNTTEIFFELNENNISNDMVYDLFKSILQLLQYFNYMGLFFICCSSNSFRHEIIEVLSIIFNFFKKYFKCCYFLKKLSKTSK
jgi:hypothetical protein